MASAIDRRGESRFSDVSMHVGCDSFPGCLTEDHEGHLLHNTTPGPVIRGKKEGSSPDKRKSPDLCSNYIRDAKRLRGSPGFPIHGHGRSDSAACAAVQGVIARKRVVFVIELETVVAIAFPHPASVTVPTGPRSAYSTGTSTTDVDTQPSTEHPVRPDAVPAARATHD